jgi:amino acid transporter
MFLRKATGLVREISPLDAFNINMTNANVWANIAILLPLGLVLFAGANLWLSVLLGSIGGMFVVMAYVLMSQAMPRSGGDYVFISRAIHPAIGFVATFTMMMLTAFFAAYNCFSLGNWLLPDLFGPLGAMTHDRALVNFAEWVAGRGPTIGLLVLSVLLLWFIFSRGVRFAARTQWISVFFIVLASVIGIPLLATTSPSSYLANFNTFAAYFHTSAAAMEHTAQIGGVNPHPAFSWGATIGFWPWVMVIWGYAVNSIMVGGEVRNPRRSQAYAVVIATLASAGILIAFFVLALRGIPQALLSSFGYFIYVNPAANPMPFTLYAHVPLALATNSPVVLGFFSGGVSFGLWLASIGLWLWGTRYMFAWAMDRVAPPQIAKLSTRGGAGNVPVYALAVMGILTLMFGLLLVYVPNFSYVTGSLLQACVFLLGCVAAIVLPYRLRKIYSSSIKSEILGVPVVSIFGAVGAVFLGVMVYYFVTNSAFGAVTGSAALFSVVVIAVGIVYYIAAVIINRRAGRDLRLTYREIPPE